MNKDQFINYLKHPNRPVSFLLEWGDDKEEVFTSDWYHTSTNSDLFWIWGSGAPGLKEYYIGTIFHNRYEFGYRKTSKSVSFFDWDVHAVLLALIGRFESEGEYLSVYPYIIEDQQNEDLATGQVFNGEEWI